MLKCCKDMMIKCHILVVILKLILMSFIVHYTNVMINIVGNIMVDIIYYYKG